MAPALEMDPVLAEQSWQVAVAALEREVRGLHEALTDVQQQLASFSEAAFAGAAVPTDPAEVCVASKGSSFASSGQEGMMRSWAQRQEMEMRHLKAAVQRLEACMGPSSGCAQEFRAEAPQPQCYDASPRPPSPPRPRQACLGGLGATRQLSLARRPQTQCGRWFPVQPGWHQAGLDAGCSIAEVVPTGVEPCEAIFDKVLDHEALVQLVQECDEDSVLNLLMESRFTPASVVPRTSGGRTALQLAAERGLNVVCRALLDRGDYPTMAIDAQDTNGWTALHWAAMEGHADMCKVLLGHPRFTAVNATDHLYCWTALHCASRHGHLAACEALLQDRRFLVVNARDRDLWSALHCAAAYGHAEVCKLLLDSPRFTEAASPDIHGRTATDLARGRARQVVQSLMWY